MREYLVLDIGGTFIKYAMMDEKSNILEKGKIPSPTQDSGQFFRVIEDIARPWQGRFHGAAVSVPGCIDRNRGVAITGGAFSFLQNTPLADLLQKRLGVPVTLANDAHCAAWAEVWNGALTDVGSGCVVILGTGIGGGIVLDGKVLEGYSFSAGQFSALPVDFERVYHGMTESGADGLYQMWTGRVSAAGLLHSYAVRKGLPGEGHGLSGLDFFAAYDAGEPEAIQTLEEFGKQAAAGIYSIQAVLDLPRFAVGGGISARPEVTQVIRTSLDILFSVFPYTPFKKPEIVTCRYGNDANLIGALRFHIGF